MTLQFKDNFNRPINYLRMAVTDRCNLRCQYCMPRHGINYVQRADMLSWDEMSRLCRIFTDRGVTKIRITGGEPFTRPGLTDFLRRIKELKNSPQIGITTNGTLLNRHLDRLQSLGVTNINISLDSLSPKTFAKITRQGDFIQTIDAVDKAYNLGFRLKVNMVVLPGMNDHEIPDFVEMTRTKNITVRFIEPMPFNGADISGLKPITGNEIIETIQNRYLLTNLGENSSKIARIYQVPGYLGKIGIIYGYSRSFCDSCSRIRVSATGQVRTCLYGQNVLDLRGMLRNHAADTEILNAIEDAISHRDRDGLEAEAAHQAERFDSMAAIGG